MLVHAGPSLGFEPVLVSAAPYGDCLGPAFSSHLSRLLRAVEAGEEVVITRGGEPVARIERVEPPPQKQWLIGRDVGRAFMSADFDDPLPEFEEWEQTSIFPE
jgi:antitoxin (DNA-binding transcriptional repressor) of toxin-antitoxin stability system